MLKWVKTFKAVGMKWMYIAWKKEVNLGGQEQNAIDWNCVTPKFTCWSAKPVYMRSKEVIRLNKVIKWNADFMGIVSF